MTSSVKRYSCRDSGESPEFADTGYSSSRQLSKLRGAKRSEIERHTTPRIAALLDDCLTPAPISLA